MSTKNEYSKFKRIFDHGALISKANKNIGYNIKLFSVKGMYGDLKQNNDKQKESEVKKLLVGLNEEKGISNLHEFPSSEEYEEFLENMFANVDDEDRYGEVNLRTAQSFRICADLIEVMKNWGDIPVEWAKKMKYCKFKSIDISKCIKNCTTPVRGNPNEKNEDIELNKELDDLNIEVQKDYNQKNITNNNMKKNLNDNNENTFYENINHNINSNLNAYNFQENNPQDTTLDFNGRESFLNKIHSSDFPISQRENIIDDLNEEELKNFDINNLGNKDQDYNENHFGQKRNSNSYSNNNNNININNNINSNEEKKNNSKNFDLDIKDYHVTNQTPRDDKDINTNKNKDTNINSHDGNKNKNKEFFNPNSLQTGKDPKSQLNKTKIKDEEVKAIENFIPKKPELKLKKLDFNLPVKFKSSDYFKLQSIITKLMSNAKKDMESNCEEKAIENLNLAKFYLTKIEY